MRLFSRKDKARAGLDAARAIIEDPKLRSAAAEAAHAAAEAAQPVAKLSAGVGGRVAKRRAERKLGDLDRAIDQLTRKLNFAAQQTADQTSEFSRGVEQLKALQAAGGKQRRRVGPTLLAGMAIGGGAVLLLEPGEEGRARRRGLRSLVSRGGAPA